MHGVFNSSQPKHKSQPKNTYKVGHSIRLLSSHDILKAQITQELFELVYPLSQLPEDYFELCYKGLVKQFAAYANILPRNLEHGLGSLYCTSLYGAYHTLKMFIEDKPESDCLWRFAVFSAALMKKSNAPALAYQVIITDSEGHYVEKWNPFEGSLEAVNAKYCKLYTWNNLFVHNHAILIGMAIKQIMPDQPMKWLQTNGDLFSQWLDCLQSEHDTAGVLGEALEPLKDESLIETWEDRLTVEQVETPETAPGEILDQWIREAIANGDIKINTPDAPIQIISDGISDAMFVDQGVSHGFAQKIANSPVSMAQAVAQFHSLVGPSQQHALALAMPGLTRRNSFMGAAASGGGESRKVHTGGLVDPSSYFEKNKNPAKSTHVIESKKGASDSSRKRLGNIIEDKGNAQASKKTNFSTRSF
jgi:hypothetical protein